LKNVVAPAQGVEIVRVLPASESGDLAGFCLDSPAADSHQETYTVPLAGWVIGRERPVRDVAVSYDEQVLRCTPVALERPDVAAVHGEAGSVSGFDTAIGVASLPREGRLGIHACFEDGTFSALAEIDYRRCPLNSGFSPRLQPLMVTSLFRMGTTRLMRLLSEHPEIVVERSYPYETCVASYWIHAFKILTEPANLHESSHPNDFVEQRRWIGHNPFCRPPITANPEVARWLGRGAIEEVAAFCQHAAERFYHSVASGQDEGSPRYFAEKHLPDSHVPDTLHEWYTGAREVFLVRDLRDVICSMLAFNEKRGFPSFGRQKVDSDEEMIELFAERCLRLANAWQRRSAAAMLVRYEDLVREPAEVMTAVLRHVGLDDSAATVGELIERADGESEEMDFHRTTKSPGCSIGRWREDLPEGMASLARELLDLPLAVFGYEPTA